MQKNFTQTISAINRVRNHTAISATLLLFMLLLSAKPAFAQGGNTQTLTNINPTCVTVRTTDLPITVTGTNFNASSRVQVSTNGANFFDDTTVLNSATQLTATIPAATYLSNASTLTIRVVYIQGTERIAVGTATLSVYAPLNANSITGPTQVCEGSQNVPYSAPLGFKEYKWALTGGVTFASGEEDDREITLNFVSPTSPPPTIELIATGCDNTTSTVKLTVNVTPGNLTPAPTINNITEDQIFFTGDAPITLTGSPAGGNFSGPGVTTTNGITTFNPCAAGAGEKTITYTSSAACNNATSVKVNVTATTYSVINRADPFPICKGQNTLYTAYVYRDVIIVDVRDPRHPQHLEWAGMATTDFRRISYYRYWQPDVVRIDGKLFNGEPATLANPASVADLLVPEVFGSNGQPTRFDYDWIRNGTSLQANAQTTRQAGLSSTDVYYVKVKLKTGQSLGCNNNIFTTPEEQSILPADRAANPKVEPPVPGESNRLWYSTPPTYTFNLTASTNPVCPGQEVTFTATADYGGLLLSGLKLYFYKRVGNQVITLNPDDPRTSSPATIKLTATTINTPSDITTFSNGDVIFVSWETNEVKCLTQGTAESQVAMIVNTVTTATANNVTECAENTAIFTATASGTGPFTYQWFKGASTTPLTNIPGKISISTTSSNTNTLTISNLSDSDGGNYNVIITGACGSTQPFTVNLKVNPNYINALRDPGPITIDGDFEYNKPATFIAHTADPNDNVAWTYEWIVNYSGGIADKIHNDDNNDATLNLTAAEMNTNFVNVQVIQIAPSGLPCVNRTQSLIGNSPNQTPLPVELIYLKATKQDNNVVELEWATAMEQNSEGFEVQVSQDAQNYRTLAFVASKAGGNTNQKQVYTFHDKENGKYGTRYYRLMQRDLNGNSEYFGPKAVQIGEATESLSVYPNPFTSEVNLDIQAEEAGTMHVVVTNAIGAKVLERTLPVEKGSNKQNLKFNGNLPQGMYNITTRMSGKVQHFKLLKQQ